MAILFGVFWLIASITTGLLIQGKILKSKKYYMVGLGLILLSFLFGFSLLVAVLVII